MVAYSTTSLEVPCYHYSYNHATYHRRTVLSYIKLHQLRHVAKLQTIAVYALRYHTTHVSRCRTLELAWWCIRGTSSSVPREESSTETDIAPTSIRNSLNCQGSSTLPVASLRAVRQINTRPGIEYRAAHSSHSLFSAVVFCQGDNTRCFYFHLL